MVRGGRAGIAALGRLAVSLPLQIESREFLQVSVSHALQLDFETLLQLADAALIAIAGRCCGARRVIGTNLPCNNQARRRAKTARRLRF